MRIHFGRSGGNAVLCLPAVGNERAAGGGDRRATRKSLWHRMRRHRNGIRMEGALYCRPECLQSSLAAHLRRLQEQALSQPPSNRIPLGLLMVARGKLTYNEV